MPPTYSPVRWMGKGHTNLREKDRDVELKPKLLVIDEIELLDYSFPEIRVRVVCSKGTYIRALARDIGACVRLRCTSYRTGANTNRRGYSGSVY